MKTIKERVEESLLRRRGKPVSAADLAEAVGASERRVRSALLELVQTGWAMRESSSEWRVVNGIKQPIVFFTYRASSATLAS